MRLSLWHIFRKSAFYHRNVRFLKGQYQIKCHLCVWQFQLRTVNRFYNFFKSSINMLFDWVKKLKKPYIGLRNRTLRYCPFKPGLAGPMHSHFMEVGLCRKIRAYNATHYSDQMHQEYSVEIIPLLLIGFLSFRLRNEWIDNLSSWLRMNK